jgi:hypothetical protein
MGNYSAGGGTNAGQQYKHARPVRRKRKMKENAKHFISFALYSP